MIVLPAGTPKYLLLHPSEIERNFQRRYTGGPIAAVAEPDAYYGFRVTNGYAVLADGPVVLAYNQIGVVAKTRDLNTNRQTEHRAAYMTMGRVAIAETREEAETLGLPEEPATTDAKPSKNKKESSGKAE